MGALREVERRCAMSVLAAAVRSCRVEGWDDPHALGSTDGKAWALTLTFMSLERSGLRARQTTDLLIGAEAMAEAGAAGDVGVRAVLGPLMAKARRRSRDR